MSTTMLRVIVDGLNSPPFNSNITIITFDSINADKLLQTLSDVLCWIQGTDKIDIRSEAPDETAMRILNTLRILNQAWRLDILEGNKQAVYPVLEWIFTNVDRLKERVYLAKYLTKIEIPPDVQTPELMSLAGLIEQKMNEFKAIHSRIIEIRSDYVRAEDVRTDLRTMEDEKDQLMRKLERSKFRIGDRVPDLKKYLELAAQYRQEVEKQQELMAQKQEQRDGLLLLDQRMTRLQRQLHELERERDTSDPQKFLEKHKIEAETNHYIVHEKLPKDIANLKTNIESVRKILSMRTVTTQDIAGIKQKIEDLNKEVMEMTLQRDKKDETAEDKLSIYRHQAASVQRKKSNVAEQLQQVRQQLEYLENRVSQKKRELGLKNGSEELVTTAQYKNYLNKMRLKTNLYKRKKLEMDQLDCEVSVLRSTREILQGTWETLKKEIQSQGRGVIGDAEMQTQRPQTAKPSSKDVGNLKQMVKELGDQLTARRQATARLDEEITEFSQQQKKENEEFVTNQTQINSMEAEIEREERVVVERVDDLNSQLKTASEKIEKLKNDVEMHQWFVENVEDANGVDTVVEKLEKNNSECLTDVEQIRNELKNLLQRANATEQIVMWKSLIQAFQKKIDLHKQKLSGVDRPIGDAL